MTDELVYSILEQNVKQGFNAVVGFDFYNGKGAVSAFNHYGDVANQALGAGNATTHVINLQVASGYSIGDNFDRPNSDITTARYRVNTNNKSSFGMDSDGSVLFG